jgi:hypothetical protein
VNDATIPRIEVINNEIADCVRETQWVVESITRDMREHAEFFGQYKRYRVWAAFLNTDADLLNRSWLQLRQNLTLMSQSTGTRS